MTPTQRQAAIDQIFDSEFGTDRDEILLETLEKCTDDELHAWLAELGFDEWDGETWLLPGERDA